MRKLRTQDELIESWGGNLDPLVSISCITYNHELYIRDAIEGFLIQETEFPFEVLIHDDASTDRTADIIREYEFRYPAIVKPIYQTENQHSKGVGISSTFNYSRASGEFIARCEGDDHWIDKTKLHTQVAALRMHPTCDISFHPAVAVDMNGNRRTICHYGSRIAIHSPERVIVGGGGYMPSASVVIRTSLIEPLVSFKERYSRAPAGDVITQAIGSARGGAVYVPIVASVYRMRVPGSWSHRIRTDVKLTERWVISSIEANRNLDTHLSRRFHRTFRRKSDAFLVVTALNDRLRREFRRQCILTYGSLQRPWSRWFCFLVIDHSGLLAITHVAMHLRRILRHRFSSVLRRARDTGAQLPISKMG